MEGYTKIDKHTSHDYSLGRMTTVYFLFFIFQRGVRDSGVVLEDNKSLKVSYTFSFIHTTKKKKRTMRGGSFFYYFKGGDCSRK